MKIAKFLEYICAFRNVMNKRISCQFLKNFKKLLLCRTPPADWFCTTRTPYLLSEKKRLFFPGPQCWNYYNSFCFFFQLSYPNFKAQCKKISSHSKLLKDLRNKCVMQLPIYKKRKGLVRYFKNMCFWRKEW